VNEKTDKARADFREAWAAISRCLAAGAVEERERLLAAAYFDTPMPARNAFVLALVSIVADRQVSP
jgi:hypothetical protein